MSTQKGECGSFTGYCIMLWNGRLVRQPCKNFISIIEGDLQDTVETPLREFRDRDHGIEMAANRMAGRLCKSIYVELDTAFIAAERFVESRLRQQVS